MGSNYRNGRIVLRSVNDLTLHPAAELVPPAPAHPASEDHSADNSPIEFLRNKQVVFGREQYEQARKTPRRKVPTVIIDEPADFEMYVLSRALDAHYLTDDQRACLAVEYAAKLSARMRKERAVKAAAVRYGRPAYRHPYA